MGLLCLGALLLGFVTSLAFPFLLFACGMAVVTVAGVTIGIYAGHPVLQAVLNPVCAFLTSQVGYAVGLIAVAIYHAIRELLRGPVHISRGDHPNRHLGDTTNIRPR